MTYRIMIVEDEYWTAMDLAVELEDRNVEVLGPFSSVPATVEALSRTDRPDAAILDIRLRDTETYSVADLLMQNHIPFVFATAYLKQDVPERFAHVPIFEKPYCTPPAPSAPWLWRYPDPEPALWPVPNMAGTGRHA